MSKRFMTKAEEAQAVVLAAKVHEALKEGGCKSVKVGIGALGGALATLLLSADLELDGQIYALDLLRHHTGMAIREEWYAAHDDEEEEAA